MLEQRAEHALIPGEAAGTAPGCVHERVEIGGGVVGERIAFRMPPDEFDRVELGGVRRQEFDPHAAVGREPALDHDAAMRIAPIPNDRDRRPDQAQQVPEKVADAAGVDARIGREAKQTPHAISAGWNYERRDHGDFLPRSAALIQDRGLAARRPGLAHAWRDQDARLIDEDQRGAATRGVFLPAAAAA